MKNRIHIFTGHFGSGKTEVALNFALQEKKKGKDVVIVDLDIVNPYFRTNDARNVLMKNGIKVVANNYASSNVDMPTMPLDILSVFNNDNSVVVLMSAVTMTVHWLWDSINNILINTVMRCILLLIQNVL